MGGEAARIVVSKKHAKPLIFACLRDSFRPMTITTIFKQLKAVVPSPVLKACLDDMSGNTTSDDKQKDGKERSEGSPCDGEDFDDTVSIRLGRNVSGTLYYMKQEKLDNAGDGLLPEDKTSLISNLHKASQERASMLTQLKRTEAEASRLVLEPTNKEVESEIEREEENMADLSSELDDCRQFLAYEKVRKTTRKRVQFMADHWWKRRRLCVDFLRMLEECTDGAVSLKKCMAGSGQIDMESDEAVVKAARECYKNRGTRSLQKSNKRKRTDNGIEPSETFIGMKMDTKGYISRVHADG